MLLRTPPKCLAAVELPDFASATDRAGQLIARNRLPLTSREILQREEAGAELVFSGNQRVLRAKFAGGLKGFLQAEGRITELNDNIVTAGRGNRRPGQRRSQSAVGILQ